jgi:hypothetical protein
MTERAEIVSYIRLVASRFQSFGFPESVGQAEADKMTDFLRTLADDIEDGAHLDDQ